MSRVVVVTSGKGGVGKTTTSSSFAAGLAMRGYKTAVIDFDVGLRNLDLIMGCERRVIYDFVDVCQKQANLHQALIRDKRNDNLYILAASQTRDKDALEQEAVGNVIDELKSMGFDYIVCDSPAGIERGAYLALYYADDALIVTNPEISSVRDSDRILGILDSRSKAAENGLRVNEKLVITRFSPERVVLKQMMKIEDVIELLSIPLLGVIPESNDVLVASNLGTPVIFEEHTIAGQAYSDLVDRFLGQEDLPHRFLEPKKRGLIAKMFGV